MFIHLKEDEINSDNIYKIKLQGKNIVITDVTGDKTVYFFASDDEAKKERDRILTELNNGK